MLVMMWNTLGIPCLYDASVYRAKNIDEATKARGFPSGNRLMARKNSQAQTGVNLTLKLNSTLKAKVNRPYKQ